MALYLNPLEAIYKAIETQNKLTLARDEYAFGTPTVIEVPDGSVNTEIVVTASTPRSPYEGSVTVQYRRLNLGDLQRFLPLPIRANGIVTTADVISVLNANFGMALTAQDLVQETITSLTDDVGQITLTAKPDSLGWIGSVVLDFVKGNININTALATKYLPGLIYPALDETKPYGELYSYWRDFTSKTAELDSVTVENQNLEAVKTALIAVTTHPWVTNAAGRYSLQGATITYAGVTTGRTDVNAHDYGKVVILDLGAGSLGYSGRLVLHYGVPPDGL